MFLAFLTCIYDVTKGLLSVFIIIILFRLPAAFAYLAGVSAVLGHKFPFYLGFKGGRGIAATVGLFLYIFIKILVHEFTFMEIHPLFIYILVYALLIMLATHGKGDLFTISIFPLMGIYLLLHLHMSAELLFFLALSCIMAAEAGRNLARDQIILASRKSVSWRVITRPFTLLFIPIGMRIPEASLQILTGCILGLFFLFDLLRIILPKVEEFSQTEITPGFRICTREEQGKISPQTDYFLGLFLSFLLFERDVAFASLGFVSISAWFAELVEINFGKNRIFAKSEKTLEGSLAFLSAAVTIAFFLWSSELLPLPVASTGALAALLIAAIPGWNDKALTIPLISGVVMSML